MWPPRKTLARADPLGDPPSKMLRMHAGISLALGQENTKMRRHAEGRAPLALLAQLLLRRKESVEALRLEVLEGVSKSVQQSRPGSPTVPPAPVPPPKPSVNQRSAMGQQQSKEAAKLQRQQQRQERQAKREQRMEEKRAQRHAEKEAKRAEHLAMLQKNKEEMQKKHEVLLKQQEEHKQQAKELELKLDSLNEEKTRLFLLLKQVLQTESRKHAAAAVAAAAAAATHSVTPRALTTLAPQQPDSARSFGPGMLPMPIAHHHTPGTGGTLALPTPAPPKLMASVESDEEGELVEEAGGVRPQRPARGPGQHHGPPGVGGRAVPHDLQGQGKKRPSDLDWEHQEREWGRDKDRHQVLGRDRSHGGGPDHGYGGGGGGWMLGARNR